MQTRTLIIACGAIAAELVRIKRLNDWQHIEIQCLPADLHNTPEEIPAAVRSKIESSIDDFPHIFVAYGDCGTGGKLDQVLDKYGIERIPGAHCYQFFTGIESFDSFAEVEPGTFYVTDFLVRHFERLVLKALRLDEENGMIPFIFSNYKRLLYLAQTESAGLQAMARQYADFLGLEYQYHFTSDKPLSLQLESSLLPKTRNKEPNFR